jgi:hypothetical protein
VYARLHRAERMLDRRAFLASPAGLHRENEVLLAGTALYLAAGCQRFCKGQGNASPIARESLLAAETAAIGSADQSRPAFASLGRLLSHPLLEPGELFFRCAVFALTARSRQSFDGGRAAAVSVWLATTCNGFELVDAGTIHRLSLVSCARSEPHCRDFVPDAQMMLCYNRHPP